MNQFITLGKAMKKQIGSIFKLLLKTISEAKLGSRSDSEFRTKLRLQGIDVLFRRNDEGRIYGTTFFDLTTHTILNSSRLGKEYSANVFNDLYGGKQEQVQESIKESTRHTL